MEQRGQHDAAQSAASATFAGPAHEAQPSVDDAPHDSAPVDSGVDAGSSSEYDQENHGDHVLQAHNNDDSFSDEG